jgi:hypothetical protein
LAMAAADQADSTEIVTLCRRFPEPIQRLVGPFPNFGGTVTSQPRIW